MKRSKRRLLGVIPGIAAVLAALGAVLAPHFSQ